MTPITLNLDPSLVKFIKTFAKENWITQKEVVEMSLKEKRKIKLRQEIIAESIELANNKELQEECLWLANAWLEDYNKNLKQIENDK